MQREVGITEAALILGVHPNTLRKWADEGLVPFILRPSGHRRFDRERLEQFREDMQQEPKGKLAA